MSIMSLSDLADRELSLPSRLGYVGLLLVSMMMSILIGALWLTEPALPARTQLAFGVMLCIGASWTGFAIWVLAARRVLLARQRVVACGMALAFSAVFTVGAALVSPDRPAAAAAAAAGLAMTLVAAAMLASARRKLTQLRARRDALERQLVQK